MSVETMYICKRFFLQIEDCERDRNTAWVVDRGVCNIILHYARICSNLFFEVW